MDLKKKLSQRLKSFKKTNMKSYKTDYLTKNGTRRIINVYIGRSRIAIVDRVFKSSEPKVEVSSSCLFPVFFSRTTGPGSTKLGTINASIGEGELKLVQMKNHSIPIK